jgi:Raf kinase inhibitor-like YbhB/YbcL family protein
MPGSRAMVVLVALMGVATSCGGGGGDAPPPDRSPATLQVGSPAFADGATIPARFTCSGAGDAPRLRWTGVPGRARSLALTVEDPDAPGGTYVHWVVVNLPAGDGGLAGAHVLPPGARVLQAWRPPCPPKGDSPHRYVFTVSALRARLGRDASADDIAGASLAHGTLTGRFGRSG